VKLSNENKDFISFNGFQGRFSRLFNDFILFKLCISIKPKLVIFFDPDLLLFMGIYKLLFNTKIIYDNHEDYPSYIMVKESIPLWIRRIIKLAYIVNFYVAKHMLDYIIYADQFTSGINLRKSNEIIIYNYPIVTNISTVEKKYDLIYPGSLDLSVCQRLLSIAEELERTSAEKIKFLIIGRDVSDTNRIFINSFIKKLQNVEIIFFEDLSFTSVQKYISESKIGLIPLPDIEKFRRNIPTKLFEYMLHSIPILASDLPPISYFLGSTDGNISIKEEKYYCSYAKKILEILGNYFSFSEASKGNFNLLREKWNWNKTEEPKLLKMIHDLVGES